MNTTTTYTITSIKHTETFRGTLDEAIERARAIDAEYQPAYGVQVEGEDGETLWDTEQPAEDDLEARIAGLPGSPQQVHAGWVWYMDGGHEPFRAPTRERLIRDVLDAVARMGVEGALGDAS